MNPETLDALKASIRHWDENARAKTPDDAGIFGPSCALCTMFVAPRAADDGCTGCPVFEKTGLRGCSGTPHRLAANAYWDWQLARGGRADFHAAARVEAAFLRSLLPEGETVEEPGAADPAPNLPKVVSHAP